MDRTISLHFTLALTLLALALSPAVAAVHASAGLPHAIPMYHSTGLMKLVVHAGHIGQTNIFDIVPDITITLGYENLINQSLDSYYGDRWLVDYLRLQEKKEVYVVPMDLNAGNPGTGQDGILTDDMPIQMAPTYIQFLTNYGDAQAAASAWEAYVESSIDNYVGIVDGIVLDECTPTEVSPDLSSDPVKYFNQSLINIIQYAKNQGLKVAVNGSMYYAKFADIYLWTHYIDTYDPTSNKYVLLTSFLQEQTYNSPLEWVNGLSRYNYLKQNNLLYKTIAVTYVDAKQYNTTMWGRAAYYLTRIMGLAGWSYTDASYYMSTLEIPVRLVRAYPIGLAVSDPAVATNHASRVFLAAGNVTIQFTTSNITITMNPGYTYPVYTVIIDGYNTSEYSNLLQTPQTGEHSTINKLGIANTQDKVYIFANWTYTATPDTTNPTRLLEILLDTDGDPNTGLQVTTSFGADYNITIYSNQTMEIQYYNNTLHQWIYNGKPIGVLRQTGNTYQAELAVYKGLLQAKTPGLDEANAKIITAAIYNNQTDTQTNPQNLPQVKIETPDYYQQPRNIDTYTGLITNTTLTPGKLEIISNGPHGKLVNYTIIVPYTQIQEILKNGTQLNTSAGESWTVKGTINNQYTILTITAQHNSPINLTIIPQTTTPVPEPPTTTIATLITLTIIITIYRKLPRN